VGTKIKKVKSKIFRRYQKSAKKSHICETDDSYDASWYCRKGGKLERVGERRPWNLKTRRKVLINYQKIVSKTESEEFSQEKEEKVYTEPKEIVDSKDLEIQEVEAICSEVDLPGTRTPVTVPKDLYRKEKEEEINNREND
ncbi:37320_t:CDS:2, partial [Gigaspora margarita]